MADDEAGDADAGAALGGERTPGTTSEPAPKLTRSASAAEILGRLNQGDSEKGALAAPEAQRSALAGNGAPRLARVRTTRTASAPEPVSPAAAALLARLDALRSAESDEEDQEGETPEAQAAADAQAAAAAEETCTPGGVYDSLVAAEASLEEELSESLSPDEQALLAKLYAARRRRALELAQAQEESAGVASGAYVAEGERRLRLAEVASLRRAALEELTTTAGGAHADAVQPTEAPGVPPVVEGSPGSTDKLSTPKLSVQERAIALRNRLTPPEAARQRVAAAVARALPPPNTSKQAAPPRTPPSAPEIPFLSSSPKGANDSMWRLANPAIKAALQESNEATATALAASALAAELAGARELAEMALVAAASAPSEADDERTAAMTAARRAPHDGRPTAVALPRSSAASAKGAQRTGVAQALAVIAAAGAEATFGGADQAPRPRERYFSQAMPLAALANEVLAQAARQHSASSAVSDSAGSEATPRGGAGATGDTPIAGGAGAAAAAAMSGVVQFAGSLLARLAAGSSHPGGASQRAQREEAEAAALSDRLGAASQAAARAEQRAEADAAAALRDVRDVRDVRSVGAEQGGAAGAMDEANAALEALRREVQAAEAAERALVQHASFAVPAPPLAPQQPVDQPFDEAEARTQAVAAARARILARAAPSAQSLFGGGGTTTATPPSLSSLSAPPSPPPSGQDAGCGGGAHGAAAALSRLSLAGRARTLLALAPDTAAAVLAAQAHPERLETLTALVEEQATLEASAAPGAFQALADAAAARFGPELQALREQAACRAEAAQAAERRRRADAEEAAQEEARWTTRLEWCASQDGTSWERRQVRRLVEEDAPSSAFAAAAAAAAAAALAQESSAAAAAADEAAMRKYPVRWVDAVPDQEEGEGDGESQKVYSSGAAQQLHSPVRARASTGQGATGSASDDDDLEDARRSAAAQRAHGVAVRAAQVAAATAVAAASRLEADEAARSALAAAALATTAAQAAAEARADAALRRAALFAASAERTQRADAARRRAILDERRQRELADATLATGMAAMAPAAAATTLASMQASERGVMLLHMPAGAAAAALWRMRTSVRAEALVDAQAAARSAATGGRGAFVALREALEALENGGNGAVRSPLAAPQTASAPPSPAGSDDEAADVKAEDTPWVEIAPGEWRRRDAWRVV